MNSLQVSGRHQGGRKGPIGHPAWHQGGRKGPPGGTREAPERPERTNWTAYEAPGRQEKTNWTAWEAPERHQGDQKCKELSSQITASIFWKKNAPKKYRHRF